MKDEKWYRNEVAKVLAIVHDANKDGGMVARTYMQEKLQKILDGSGVSIHPTLEPLAHKILDKGGEERATCHDCGAKEGEIHEFGCDMERCPFCDGQLLGCDCCYVKLKLIDTVKYSGATSFLSPQIYNNGLSETQENKWVEILERKGRVPYISLPLKCAKCLQAYPEFFRVSDKEWKKLPKMLHEKILCRECYDKIIEWIEEGKIKNERRN